MAMSEYAYSAKVNKSKKLNNSKLILLVTACVAVLGLIFFLSFYISYNRISADRKLYRSEKDTISEQAQLIEEMKSELSAKDEEIETLMAQLEEQDAIIEDLKGKEEYAKMIADELKNLPKETRTSTPPPQPQSVQSQPKSSNSSGASGQSNQSDVQNDIYVKPVR